MCEVHMEPRGVTSQNKTVKQNCQLLLMWTWVNSQLFFPGLLGFYSESRTGIGVSNKLGKFFCVTFYVICLCFLVWVSS